MRSVSSKMRFPKPRSGASIGQSHRRLITIGAKPFFEAIGEQDNRNRRWRQPYSVKIKLMGFEYVFADRGHQYLAMETEKLDYFSGNQGIDRSYLPGRVYRSKERPDRDGPIRSSSRARLARRLLWSVLATSTGRSESPRASTLTCCTVQRSVRSAGLVPGGIRHGGPVYVSEGGEHFLALVCGGSGRGPNGMPLDPEVRRLLDHVSRLRSVRTTADGLVRQAPTGPTQR